MELEFHAPSHPQLAELIAGFYFVRNTNWEELHYQTFPNNYSILSVLKNSVVTFTGNRAECRPSEKPLITSNLTISYHGPISINYYGPVNELTIYFRPLALQSFFAAESSHAVGAFSEFIGSRDFNDLTEQILEMKDRTEQISALEDYLLSKVQFEIDPFLCKLLAEVQGRRPISEIAEKMGISRQYLNRLFSKHFGKSPMLFRKISRFRNAVRASINANTISDLTFDNFFYDQSHLIRDFRELTHLSPKVFLKGIDPEKEIPWLYI